MKQHPSLRAISLQEAEKGLLTAGWREKGKGKDREKEKKTVSKSNMGTVQEAKEKSRDRHLKWKEMCLSEREKD